MLAQHWQFTRFARPSAPRPAADSGYAGTSLEISRTHTNQTLVEQWNGSAWAIVASPNSIGQYNVLQGVTCVSAADCWSAGYSSNSTTYQTLVEQWDGSAWAIVASSNTNDTQPNALQGVTCVSAADCWVVGYSANGTAYQTLVEQWDGSAWAIVASPNPIGSLTTVLQGVTCVSPADCWAVGLSFNGITDQTLIEQWSGGAWAIVASPNAIGSLATVLQGVTCVSAAVCWSVGYDAPGVGYTDQTLVEQWNGSAWAIVTSPNTSGAQTNALQGVTCVSAADCWAVGHVFNGSVSAWQTLVERWNGSAWAIVASPNATASPSPAVPEAPWVPLLPLAAVAALATRLRGRRPPSQPLDGGKPAGRNESTG